MGFRSKQLLVTGMIQFSAIILLSPVVAHAFGPAKPPAPSYTLPNPVRGVIVRPFSGVSAFETPNQVTTTLNDAITILTEDAMTAASATGLLSVVQGGISDLDPCGSHLEIWPSVTDFELDSMSIDVKFGFNSTGTINVGQPQVSAEDTVSLGNVGFSLLMYECDNATSKNCSSIPGVESTVNQSVLSNEGKFNLTWSAITASGDIFNKSDLGKDVQSMLDKAANSLVAVPAMAQVPWQTLVESVDSRGNITMLAGADEKIAANQYFTVYSGSTSSCSAIEALACIATTQVDGPTSIAKVYRTLVDGANRPIQAGDIVQVGDPACAP
jgi:hypothetical protein